ncbi:Acetyltransferase (GNAT) family protein [Blastococcus fimeti]|nr:Acetyltransferase (GNAT) family protein [Blastococcus fimeti]
MTHVRPATRADYPAVLALERQLLQAHVDGMPADFDPSASDFTEHGFRRRISRPWSTVLVVEVDGTVAAYAAMSFVTATPVERVVARLPRRVGPVVETAYRSLSRVRPGRPSPIVRRPAAFIDSFAVDASVRRQRLAETLWEACVRWAEERGAPEIQCETFEFNKPILGFVEHVGLTLYKRRYRFPLTGSDSAGSGQSA